MKRKAMLMGMAVMTGLPGWAMAKDVKAASGDHRYADSLESQVTHTKVETDNWQPLSKEESALETSEKSAELLAKVKSILRQANYGMVAKPAADNLGWKLEMLDNNTWAYDKGDIRQLQAKPIGVAFRFSF